MDTDFERMLAGMVEQMLDEIALHLWLHSPEAAALAVPPPLAADGDPECLHGRPASQGPCGWCMTHCWDCSKPIGDCGCA